MSGSERGRRVRQPGWLGALALSLLVHAGALVALSAGLQRDAPRPAPRVLVMDVLPEPAGEAPEPLAHAVVLDLEPPPPAPPPSVAEPDEAPPPPEPVSSRWLYEVVADAAGSAHIGRPGEAREEADTDDDAEALAPQARAGEWQGPPAPASAPGGVLVAPAPLADNPPPDYPAAARRRGLEGLVVVRVRVLADGTAGAAEVSESSGHGILDRAARDAVAGWRFRPALRDGQPVEQDLEVPVRFRLEGALRSGLVSAREGSGVREPPGNGPVDPVCRIRPSRVA
jgi:protein TonB